MTTETAIVLMTGMEKGMAVVLVLGCVALILAVGTMTKGMDRKAMERYIRGG